MSHTCLLYLSDQLTDKCPEFWGFFVWSVKIVIRWKACWKHHHSTPWSSVPSLHWCFCDFIMQNLFYKAVCMLTSVSWWRFYMPKLYTVEASMTVLLTHNSGQIKLAQYTFLNNWNKFGLKLFISYTHTCRRIFSCYLRFCNVWQ